MKIETVVIVSIFVAATLTINLIKQHPELIIPPSFYKIHGGS